MSDASHDDSPTTVFAGGALRINYSLYPLATANASATGARATTGGSGLGTLHDVTIEAWQGNTKVADLGTFNTLTVTNGLVNLADKTALAGGTYSIRAAAHFNTGLTTTSAKTDMKVKSGQLANGTLQPETFALPNMTGDGIVIHGNGGTDVFFTGLLTSAVATIDGTSLATFDPRTAPQAIYQGLAVDFLRLTDGREIYLTGIERIDLSRIKPSSADAAARTLAFGQSQPQPQTKTTFEAVFVNLAVTPNDPVFKDQWNLHVTDVPEAWRFTTGSSQILLVSLDSGVFPEDTTSVGPGLSADRLITDPGDDDGTTEDRHGHGHQAISIMVGTPNDGKFQTGINWVSKVFVQDVYDSLIPGAYVFSALEDAIAEALSFADAHGLKVVFQGGIQGEYWLDYLDDADQLIRSHQNTALYAIAAGNGGPGGKPFQDDHYLTSVSGVAKLESTHNNVMSVGALEHTDFKASNGFANVSKVNIASYSNRGNNLTFVAPTDSPAVDFIGDNIFNGTSCANPNLAAMASLVWSANPNLSAGEVRDILQMTAFDLGEAGRDSTYGFGLVDVGRAVRRAVALAQDHDLAVLALNAPPPTTGGVQGGQVSVGSHPPGQTRYPPSVHAASSTALSPAVLDAVFSAAAAPTLGSTRLETPRSLDLLRDPSARMEAKNRAEKYVHRQDSAIMHTEQDHTPGLMDDDCLQALAGGRKLP